MANPRVGPRSPVLFETSTDVFDSHHGQSADTRLSVTINPRASRPSLRVDPMRRIAILTVPHRSEMGRAERFAAEHAEWVRHQLRRLPSPRPFREGIHIPVRGEEHLLVRPAARGRPRLETGSPPRLAAPGHADAFAGRVRRFLVTQAQHDFTAAARRHAAALQVSFTRLTVKDTVSRWGSCSSRGALSFSWRIVCAPPYVLDYLAAHEVSHLREANHSARFWRLVDRLTTERRRAQAWLKHEGPSLFAIGAEA